METNILFLRLFSNCRPFRSVVLETIIRFKLQDHKAVLEELDIVDEDDQFTHMLTLEDAVNPEDVLSRYSWSSF